MTHYRIPLLVRRGIHISYRLPEYGMVPEAVELVLDHGHEIGCHGCEHPLIMRLI
ncbi:MAG: hypothetical protein U9N36_03115 [Euryarchaeota archaeon]|nr:hypothetical protein [Euryarchaeota archaeon]